MKALAARLGCSEGRVASLAIGLVFGLVTAAWGIPPVVRDRSRPSAAALPAPQPQTTPASTRSDGAPSSVGEPAAPLSPVSPDDVPATGPAPQPEPPSISALAPSVAPALGAVRVFARIISPGAPEGIAVGPGGTVHVATNNAKGRGGPGPSKVLRYDARGALVGVVDVTGQPADRTSGLTGLALEPSGAVVVTDGSTGRVIRVDASGAQQVVATLFDIPACNAVVAALACEPGSVDHRPLPRGIVADASGVLYVTDAGQSTIWRIDATRLPLPIHSDPGYAGSRALGGMAINRAGQLIFTAGSVYTLAVDVLGRTGLRSRFAELPDRDGARALATSADGRVYVALTKANRVLVLDAAGKTTRRIASAAGDPVPLDAPSGIAITGRRLLVSNQSTGDHAHWAVLTVNP